MGLPEILLRFGTVMGHPDKCGATMVISRPFMQFKAATLQFALTYLAAILQMETLSAFGTAMTRPISNGMSGMGKPRLSMTEPRLSMTKQYQFEMLECVWTCGTTADQIRIRNSCWMLLGGAGRSRMVVL